MATASFFASTVVPIREPPLFFRNPNNKSSHSLIRHMPSLSKSLAIQQHHRRQPLTLIFCSSSVATPPLPPSLLSDSFRTLTSLVAVALSTSRRLFAASVAAVAVPAPSELAEIRSLQGGSACSAGSLFFAALRDRPSGYLNTPLTVVASGMAKWLDIYSGVLMVRVLLSWFPNIPWDRQPLSAIRDLCDPYLNLFRNIIPPIFDTLDVSPLLAFAVLGTLGSILKSARGMH